MKYSIIILLSICALQVFWYTPTIQDKEFITSVHSKIEQVSEQKWDSYRETLIDFLKTQSLKIKSEKKIYILEQVISLLSNKKEYELLRIIDWDTFVINIEWEEQKVRLIWIDTPEITNSQCLSLEAKDFLTQTTNNNRIFLETDLSQGSTDSFWRMLAYLFVNWKNVNQLLIENWLAYEYTYNQKKPYTYQKSFIEAENESKANKLWLHSWICPTEQIPSWETTFITQSLSADSDCQIKGNINSSKEKIYHLPTCKDYNKTKINTENGEKYFCTEQEATDAWWRIAKNC